MYGIVTIIWLIVFCINVYGLYTAIRINGPYFSTIMIIIYLLLSAIFVVLFYCFERKRSGNICELNNTKRMLEKEINERERVERVLKEKELHYRNIFENTDNAIAVYEAVNNGDNFIIKEFNKSAEIIEKVKGEEIIGKPVTEVFPGIKNFGIFEVFKRVWQSGNPEEFPLGFYKDDRLDGWRDNYIYKLPGGEIVAVYSDQTDRMKTLKERESLIKELESKNAELEQFTYTVSHDLKNPLVTIRGFLGLLEKDIEKKDAHNIKNDIVRIQNAAERMQCLLEELLDLSRIGRLVNPPLVISFSEIVKKAMDVVAGRLAEVKATINVEPDLPDVFVDGSRIQEMLVNLLDNALKFCDKSEPRIELGVRKTDNENIFYVRDNGIGVDPAFHEKIFGLFNKLDPAKEGTGAGLAIVKRIIEVHGGRIWVESEGRGKGATFCFTLPQNKNNPDKCLRPNAMGGSPEK